MMVKILKRGNAGGDLIMAVKLKISGWLSKCKKQSWKWQWSLQLKDWIRWRCRRKCRSNSPGWLSNGSGGRATWQATFQSALPVSHHHPCHHRHRHWWPTYSGHQSEVGIHYWASITFGDLLWASKYSAHPLKGIIWWGIFNFKVWSQSFGGQRLLIFFEQGRDVPCCKEVPLTNLASVHQ